MKIKNIILIISISVTSILSVKAFSSNVYAPNNPTQLFISNYQNVPINLDQSYAQQEYYENTKKTHSTSLETVVIIIGGIGMLVMGSVNIFIKRRKR